MMEYPFKDLLPLDEVLDREGYYNDWTHLDPEVFYSLTQISEYIKTKGFGVDVRLLIAQLAEHFGLKTTQVVDLGNLLTAKHAALKTQVEQAVSQVNADRNALETQFNQSVAQMQADKDAVIANATVDSEVILARGGKPTLQARLDETTAQLAQTAKNAFMDKQGLSLAEISLAEITGSYTGVQPLIMHEGWLYGFKNNTTIVKSDDEGLTWQDVATAPYGSVHSIFWSDDGEVIITNGSAISKSVGWSNNPATVTWSTKVTKSAPTGVGILPWGIDGDGAKFIATEYSGTDRTHSRYVWVSTDMGNTWKISVDKTTIDPENKSHMHGVAYDRWADRFFLSHGHGDIRGVYWSDDNGTSWNKVGGDFQPDAAPTTLFATDNGIVCGSDSNDAGLYGIARTSDPSNMEMKRLVRWDLERSGVTGFAYRSSRDEKTGQVYVAFKPDNANVRPVIMAGTATSGSFLWRHDVPSSFNFTHLAVTENKVLGVLLYLGSQTYIEADKPSFGTTNLYDKTNANRGVSRNSTSIAIGRNVEVSSENEIVIGENASLETASSNQNNVVIGNLAKGTSRSVAIGNNAKNEVGSSDSVVIGNSSNTSAISSIAIGHTASVGAGQTGGTALGANSYSAIGGVALGYGAKTGASTANAVAIGSSAYAGATAVGIGRLASAGTQQVAIGLSAVSNNLNSVALGANVTTTAENQLNIGARHLEMKKVTEPVNAPADTGRLFVKDDGAGKMQLCVRLGSTTVVLATQA